MTLSLWSLIYMHIAQQLKLALFFTKFITVPSMNIWMRLKKYKFSVEKCFQRKPKSSQKSSGIYLSSKLSLKKDWRGFFYNTWCCNEGRGSWNFTNCVVLLDRADNITVLHVLFYHLWRLQYVRLNFWQTWFIARLYQGSLCPTVKQRMRSKMFQAFNA